MRKYQLFLVGVVVSVCVLAIGFLMYTIEKIESESVASKGVKGIALYTTSQDNAEETEKILREIESSLVGNINIKVLGAFKTPEDVEEVIREEAEGGINYSLIEFNRGNMVKEKGTIAIKIPSKDAINYRDSLRKAEQIKDKAKNIQVNIIESRNTPKLLNTYIGVEVSDIESLINAKKILDNLVLLDE